MRSASMRTAERVVAERVGEQVNGRTDGRRAGRRACERWNGWSPSGSASMRTVERVVAERVGEHANGRTGGRRAGRRAGERPNGWSPSGSAVVIEEAAAHPWQLARQPAATGPCTRGGVPTRSVASVVAVRCGWRSERSGRMRDGCQRLGRAAVDAGPRGARAIASRPCCPAAWRGVRQRVHGPGAGGWRPRGIGLGPAGATRRHAHGPGAGGWQPRGIGLGPGGATRRQPGQGRQRRPPGMTLKVARMRSRRSDSMPACSTAESG